MEIALMIEGQDGLTWPRWQRIAAAAEDLGFAGLYRSDHYTNAKPPDKASLELWVSLTWLASHTSRIEFGPLVSPVSFRQPTMTARMAAAVDDLSGGRLQLGLGAGWQVREHTNYGWDLLEVGPRLDRFQEGLEVITRLLNRDEPVDFEGEYYRLKEAILLPRPGRPGGPPIVIGGNGEKRTLPLAARYADEWNGVFIDPPTYAWLNGRLDELLVAVGREPSSVRRSLMAGCVFGNDEETLRRKAAAYGRTPAEARASGMIAVGGETEMREQLGAWSAAGVERIMLQWLELDDLDGLEGLARVIQAMK
jgi:F420-dependent oxidoreductase-like protein